MKLMNSTRLITWFKTMIDYPPFNSLIQFTLVTGIAARDYIADLVVEMTIASGLTSTFEAVYSIFCSGLLQFLN